MLQYIKIRWTPGDEERHLHNSNSVVMKLRVISRHCINKSSSASGVARPINISPEPFVLSGRSFGFPCTALTLETSIPDPLGILVFDSVDNRETPTRTIEQQSNVGLCWTFPQIIHVIVDIRETPTSTIEQQSNV